MLYFFSILAISSNINNQNIFNLDENNLINIRGPIDDDTTNKFMLDVLKFPDNQEVNIYINSPGGSVMEGMKIVNQIELMNNTSRVNCISDFSASMAFIILQSCENRYAMKSSIMMQHQMSLMNKGNLFNLNNYMNMINDLNVDIDKMQAKKINMSYSEFKDKITNDWWLYGKQAKDFNVVDDIVYVKCSKTLLKNTEKIKKSTFFGDVEFSFNSCPLIRHPLKIKFNREIDTENDEYKKIINLFNSEHVLSNPHPKL